MLLCLARGTPPPFGRGGGELTLTRDTERVARVCLQVFYILGWQPGIPLVDSEPSTQPFRWLEPSPEPLSDSYMTARQARSPDFISGWNLMPAYYMGDI